MSYQVIARKYRPQQFDDVIGQAVIITTLKNAIEQKRIGHAYLFSGVRGVGKTTTARILAKALNCAQGPTATPCEACDSCREIKAGNAIDVIEIDAASNRSIDDVRQLRENVKYRPSRDRYKIYIIDEAHQLTDDAWDALLKTLEEPPDHVVFIFATTERHKLKPTILSRCQNFTFRTLSYHEIYKSLEAICQAEQMTITPGALSMLARSAEGSIRDAQSLLDQVISFCGNSIDEEKIRELLGFVAQEYLDRLSDALIERNTQSVLKLVDDAIRAGYDPRHFCREAIRHIRDLMIVRADGKDSELLELPPDQTERLAAVASRFSEEDLIRFFHLLARTDNDLKWSTQPRLHLELGFVKLVQAARLMSLEEFLADWRAGKSSAGVAAAGTPVTRASSPAPAAIPDWPVKKNNEVSSAPAARRSFMSSPLSPSATASPSVQRNTTHPMVPASRVEPRDESDDVRQLRQAVFSKSKFLASLLEHVNRIEMENSSLQLFFTQANKHFHSMLNHKDQIATLSQICQNAFGRNFQVKLIFSDDAEAVPAASSAEGANRTPQRAVGPGPAHDIANDPVVRSFVDTFRAEIVDVKKKS